MKEYKYMTLFEIAPYEKEMQVRGVSEVARSPQGFLSYYKKIGGNPQRVNNFWRNKRHSFISRTLGAYRLHKSKGHNTERQKLSLIAWAYYPNE
jgi:hypothetical protein